MLNTPALCEAEEWYNCKAELLQNRAAVHMAYIDNGL